MHPPARQPEGIFSASTRVSQVVALLLVLGYAAAWFKPTLTDYVALVPGGVVPYVWTLVSCSFLETNAVQLVFCVVALLFTARVLEPAWGSREFAKFIVLTSLLTGTAAFATMMLFYLAQQAANPRILYHKLWGFHGVVGGLLVGIKQALPDREARIFSVIRIPGKYLPTIYVLGGMVAGAIGRDLYRVGLFVAFGTYWSWWYLRFFQHKSDGRGDGSPDFRFASFFPALFHPFVDALAKACSRVTRVFPDTRAGAAPRAPAAPAAPADASRRRERGARVLEERLGMGIGIKPRQQPVVVVQQTMADSGGAPTSDDVETGSGGGGGGSQQAAANGAAPSS